MRKKSITVTLKYLVYIVEQMENAFFPPRVTCAEGPDASALHQCYATQKKVNEKKWMAHGLF